MPKETHTPKQSNTLLNYYSKSPRDASRATQSLSFSGHGNGSSPKSSSSTTPKTLHYGGGDSSKNELYKSHDKRNVNGRDNAGDVIHKQESLTSAKTVPDRVSSPVASTSKAFDNDCPFQLNDLVWAKLEGYPWWPSIVCDHPTVNHFIKRKGKTQMIHVQFFDDPVSRSWIRMRDVKEFTGKFTSDVPLLKDKQWNQAIEWAEEALKMNKVERWTLIAELKPSDEEDNDVVLDVDYDDDNVQMTVPKESPKKDIKSPKANDEKRKVNESIVSPKKSNLEAKRKNVDHEKDQSQHKKRRIIMESSSDDDSEDDYKPRKSDDESSDDEMEIDESESDGTRDDDSDDDVNRRSKMKKNVKRDKSPDKSSNKSPKTPLTKKQSNLLGFLSSSVSKSTDKKNVNKNEPLQCQPKSRVSLFSADEFTSTNDATDESEKLWSHFSFDFLKPEKIKDKNGRRKDDPNYDPKTLDVPKTFMQQQTPAHVQWWKMKSEHYDTILFFKVGKFYELFHMDAVIAVNELQLLYMKGDYAHAGFPEKSYERFADVLIRKGYKVARVEQTETPLMMEERCKQLKKPSKNDKVVAREICRITTNGTRTCSAIRNDEPAKSSNAYLLAIYENSTQNAHEIGVCFIDCFIGTFHIGQFIDDAQYSRLRTLIAHHPIVEIIYDKKNLLTNTLQVINFCAPSARKECVQEFWDAEKTLNIIDDGEYFRKNEDDNSREWPPILLKMVNLEDDFNYKAKEQYDLAIRAFGAVIRYCHESIIEDELLTMKVFEEYRPFDELNVTPSNASPMNMVLDGNAIRNLEIFENSLGGTEGTLIEVMDFCSTQFGKRLLRKWICSPLYRIDLIEDRQNAVNDMCNLSNKIDINDIIIKLKKLPDFERTLSKIHALGSARRSKTHPDSRAILFDAHIYSKRKIIDFISILNGFKESHKIIDDLRTVLPHLKSQLLIKCIKSVNDGGNFPELREHLKYFDTAFDHEKAKTDGKIIPQKGADIEYDDSMLQIKKIVAKLDEYLIEQRKYFGAKVMYFGSGKNRFQLEVPENATKKVTKEYELQSSRKGFKRYWTPYIKKLMTELSAAEEIKENVLQDIMRRIFETFDKSYNKWNSAIGCLSHIDVFISLCNCQKSMTQNSVVCLPKFTSSDVPFISLVDSKHPCLIKYCDNFIPNDFLSESELCLLTGPNMGGKSTLMRQIGLIVIMAQIGAFVPAAECTLTPVDRIFTRLGASDKIIDGESTFFVELNETSIILKHATRKSLVLLDELGRGTATFDGTAIAYAVVKELTTNIKCQTLFSTHYHSLVDSFSGHNNILIKHMACIVENENDNDPTQESITFLYKLKDGACPKSYGFNAARLAGIPEDIVRRGFNRAKKFEQKYETQRVLKKLIQQQLTNDQLCDALNSLHKLNVRD